MERWVCSQQFRPEPAFGLWILLGRGLIALGKMELFSRGEKQEEITSEFQFRSSTKTSAAALRLHEEYLCAEGLS